VTVGAIVEKRFSRVARSAFLDSERHFWGAGAKGSAKGRY